MIDLEKWLLQRQLHKNLRWPESEILEWEEKKFKTNRQFQFECQPDMCTTGFDVMTIVNICLHPTCMYILLYV